jgi:hypothetical protein
VKTDPLLEMQAVIARDFKDLGGVPERLALPLAEFAAASVAAHFARQQPYFPDACLVALRNERMRDLNRQALASVDELVILTGLNKGHVYRILQAKVNGARRPKR